MREIYLDNSATTRPFDEVTEYMETINKKMYGNPSSLHSKGLEAEKLIKKARKTIARSIDSDPREIFFTSGGTESNNLAIRGYLNANPRKGKHVITTRIEHPSVLEACKYLESKGYDIDYLDIDKGGILDVEMLKSKIRDDTALISVMAVNNETGAIQPLREIVKIKNQVKRDVVIHTDAVQAYGKIEILPAKMGIDMITMSSHKINGPKGAGALYVRRGVRIMPIIFGGGQESLMRSGTENVPGICGFGLSSQMTFEKMKENSIKVGKLKEMFIEKLRNASFACKIISPEISSPYILNAAFAGVKAEVLLHHLEEKNIFVSTGSACSSKKNLHSHVLKAMGLNTCDIESAIRFSFSSCNTEDDIIDTAEALSNILPQIIRKT
jgi:cysteine desulfurase